MLHSLFPLHIALWYVVSAKEERIKRIPTCYKLLDKKCLNNIQDKDASFDDIWLRSTANGDVWWNVATKTVIKEVITGGSLVQQHTEVRWVEHYRPHVNESLIHVVVETVNAETEYKHVKLIY